MTNFEIKKSPTRGIGINDPHSPTWYQNFQTDKNVVDKFLHIFSQFISYLSSYLKLRKVEEPFDHCQPTHQPTTQIPPTICTINVLSEFKKLDFSWEKKR